MKRRLILGVLVGATVLLVGSLAFAYQEAPMLKAKVAAGELAAVEERLPVEPLVVEPIEEIGQYGGRAQVFAANPDTWNDLQSGMCAYGGAFLEPQESGGDIEPNVAKGYEFSEDMKTLVIYLREGLKWSDGAPFTAEDIVFQFEDVLGNEKLTPAGWSWNPGGELAKTVKVSDYVVRFEFSEPYPMAKIYLQTYTGEQPFFYAPKHYLKKWHIKYNPKANELAKEENFDDWWHAFQYHGQIYPQQEDINLPRMTPWIMKKKAASAMLFERNPYYWKVDTAGNQLPYIDEVLVSVVNPEVYQLKTISGEMDYGSCNTSLANYALYKENEEKGGYRTVLFQDPGSFGSAMALGFNFNEKDPVLRKIYHNIKFRQALSLAIYRDEINEVVFFGTGVPRNVAPHPNTSYYKEEWGDYYAQYDPETANRLLDEMGLKKGEDGYRLRPDGKTLELTIEYWEREPAWTTILELVKEYWERVGVKVMLREEERPLLIERAESSDHRIMAWSSEYACELLLYLYPRCDYCFGGVLSYFADWGTESSAGMKPRDESTEYPEDTVTYQDVNDQWERIKKWQTTLMGSREYIEQAQEFLDYFCKQLWCIGTVGLTPRVYIFNSTLGNVPNPAEYNGIFPTSIGKARFVEQWFFKK